MDEEGERFRVVATLPDALRSSGRRGCGAVTTGRPIPILGDPTLPSADSVGDNGARSAAAAAL